MTETIHRAGHPQGMLNNVVIVLNCLPAHELQTAKSIYEGLLDLQHETAPRQIHYFSEIKGPEHFLKILRVYAQKWPDFEPFPIVHIEAHGDRDRGLEVEPDQYIPWPLLFAECQAINKACDNNFGLVLAACHGYELSELVKVLQPSPFAFMVSATGVVTAGVTKRVLLDFYGTFLRDLALQRALTSLPKGFDFFLSRNFFVLEIAHHYGTSRLGKGGRQKLEEQVSQAMKYGLVKQVLGVKKVRKLLKKQVITPSRENFEDWSRRFFHGRVPIDFQDFMFFVRNERWPDQFSL